LEAGANVGLASVTTRKSGKKAQLIKQFSDYMEMDFLSQDKKSGYAEL